MSETGSGVMSGVASGASTGAMFGPWGALAGGVIGGLSGLLGSKNSKKKAEEARRAAEQQRQAYLWQGQQYQNLGNRYGEESKFVPQGIRTAWGSTSVDPTTGEYVASLSPEQQAQRGQWQGLFDSEYGRLQGFDPNALAAERYGTMQSLVAPDRAKKMDSTMGMLLRRGMLGSSEQDGAGNRTNPFVSGLYRAWGDEDTKMGMEAQNWADRRRTEGLGLLSGFQGQMANFDNQTSNLFNQGQGYSSMFNNYNANRLNNQYGFYGQGIDSTFRSMLPNAAVTQANNAYGDTKTAGMTGFLDKVPGMLGMFGGMFGGGGGAGIGSGSNASTNPYGIGAWNMN